jgi:hypothetical protein
LAGLAGNEFIATSQRSGLAGLPVLFAGTRVGLKLYGRLDEAGFRRVGARAAAGLPAPRSSRCPRARSQACSPDVCAAHPSHVIRMEPEAVREIDSRGTAMPSESILF